MNKWTDKFIKTEDQDDLKNLKAWGKRKKRETWEAFKCFCFWVVLTPLFIVLILFQFLKK